MFTPNWLSAYVEKTWLFLTGMVVPRLMRAIMTPPTVSIPSESDATTAGVWNLLGRRISHRWSWRWSAGTTEGRMEGRKASILCCDDKRKL